MKLFANDGGDVKRGRAVAEDAFKGVGHDFQGTLPVIDSLQAIGVGGDELLWAEGLPLEDMDEFVKMVGFDPAHFMA